MYRKIKFGATFGGLAGVISALVMFLFHKQVPPSALVSVPAFLAWATHFFASYQTKETVTTEPENPWVGFPKEFCVYHYYSGQFADVNEKLMTKSEADSFLNQNSSLKAES